MLTESQKIEIERHLPLVASTAEYYRLKFSGPKLGTASYADLHSAGCEGLIDAVRKSDKNNPGFFQYLRTRIKGAIIDFVRNQYWDNRRNLPDGTITGKTYLFSQFEDFVIEKIKSDENLIDKVQKNLDIERLAAFFKTLSPKQKLLLNLFYGRDMNGATIARLYGVSEPRINEMKKTALEILARKMGCK